MYAVHGCSMRYSTLFIFINLQLVSCGHKINIKCLKVHHQLSYFIMEEKGNSKILREISNFCHQNNDKMIIRQCQSLHTPLIRVNKMAESFWLQLTLKIFSSCHCQKLDTNLDELKENEMMLGYPLRDKYFCCRRRIHLLFEQSQLN